MGSGKSTATLHFAEKFQSAGCAACAVHENADPHPVRGTDGIEHWFQPWLDLSTRELAARGLAKWQAFVARSRDSSTVTFFDGQLFHGDLTHLLLMGAEWPEIEAYCVAVAGALRPLDPLLVYFRQADIGAAIRKVCKARGDDWVRYQTDWKLQAPYCTSRDLQGIDGLVSLYEDYRRLTDRLYDALELEKLRFETDAGSWSLRYAAIEAALEQR
jgi:hypothetical protein